MTQTDDPVTSTGCPFGQCEHTSNAHSRKHCLLCDCEKAPVVHLPPQPQDLPPDDERGLAVLHDCGICGALTAPDTREKHVAWHERQITTLENLFRAIRRASPTTWKDPQ